MHCPIDYRPLLLRATHQPRHVQLGGQMVMFKGTHFQRGHGIIKVFSAIAKRLPKFLGTHVLPYLGKKAVNFGQRVFNDIANKQASPKEAIKRRLKEVGEEIAYDGLEQVTKTFRPQSGSGYRPKRKSKKTKKTKKKKLKKKKKTTRKKSTKKPKKRKPKAKPKSRPKPKRSRKKKVTFRRNPFGDIFV